MNSGSNGNGNMSRSALRQKISEVSFSAYDTLLYLDTHPNDRDALEHFEEMSEERREAMQQYGRLYGPMTMDNTDITENNTWQWMQQPWPWEGGNC